MIDHPRVLLQQLAPDDIDVVYQSALRVLEQTGMVIQSDQACEYADHAGALVQSSEKRVRFPQDLVERSLTEVPSQ